MMNDDKPNFIEDNEPLPLPMFVTKQRDDRAERLRAVTLDNIELRRIPSLFPGERQLPSGDGQGPPSQPALDGLEHDLPHLEQGA